VNLYERIDVAGVYLRNTKTGLRLLLKRVDGRWDITKGGVDAGEDPKRAAKREAGEEAGISPAIGGTFVDVANQKNKKKLRIFNGSTPKRAVKLAPTEHTKFKWVDDDEAAEKLSKTPHLAQAVAKLRGMGESYPNRLRGQAQAQDVVPSGGDRDNSVPEGDIEQPMDNPLPGNTSPREMVRATGSRAHARLRPSRPPG